MGNAVVLTYLREHLPQQYRHLSWDELKKAPDYSSVRREAETFRPPFCPDLSEVYPDDRELVLFEIEDHCQVSRTKLEQIEYWYDLTMDAWDRWEVVLIITNRYGLGWCALVDTLAADGASKLRQFEHDPEPLLRTYPHLSSEAAIRRAFKWRNWRMPETREFDEVRNSMWLL